MTRVLVVDDAELFRTAISTALVQAGFEICGQSADAEEAISAAQTVRPDVVMLDILMPGMSGVEAVDKILAVSPESKVVMLTVSESDEDLLRCIRSGARGYLVKDAPFEELARAITDVAEGGAAISSKMGGKLLDFLQLAFRHGDFLAQRRPALTGREIEVLQHVARGMTSKQIGSQLFISENTVKNHVRNILDKLGLHSRNEAVLFAIREGLIDL
jgi:DNA-binding NarL/FixJ family response regulator